MLLVWINADVFHNSRITAHSFEALTGLEQCNISDLTLFFFWWNLLWAYSLSMVSDLAEELVVVAVLEKLCWTGWFDFVCGQPSVTGHAGNPDLRMDLVVMRSWCFCVFMDLQRRSGVQQEGVSSWHSCLQASETVFGFMGDIALTSPMPANLFIPEKTPVAHV